MVGLLVTLDFFLLPNCGNVDVVVVVRLATVL